MSDPKSQQPPAYTTQQAAYGQPPPVYGQPPPVYGQPVYPAAYTTYPSTPGAAVYTTQPGVGGQPNVIVIQQPYQMQNLNKKLRSKSLLVMGSLVVAGGILLVLLNIICLAVFKDPLTSSGFWGSVIAIIAGVCAIILGRGSKKDGIRIACMVVSIVACIVSFIAFCLMSSIATWVWIFSAPLYYFSVIDLILHLTIFIILVIMASFCCSCCYSAT